jgi:uncharacterized membrane protein
MTKKEKSAGFFHRNWKSAVILLFAAAVFFAAWHWANPGKPERPAPSGDYAEYENGKVLEILSDSCQPDETAGGGYRGEQSMTVLVQTGQYKGKTLLAYNHVAPLYNAPLSPGDRVTLILSTYENGDISASVYEYERSYGLLLIIAAFLLVTVLVGGKTGAKSLLGLALTIGCLLWVLLPALLRGAPTVPSTFLLCAYVAVVCFTLLGGINRKTLCAMLGTVAGTALAMLFGMGAQALLRINGFRTSDVEPLLQLRQTGSPVGLQGLLTAGILIGALGAVMDVAMSVSSAVWELKAVNPDLTGKQLWRSGMNIGKDMVGTMTNTLILAFMGGSFTLILYLYSLELPVHELLSSAYLSIEVISGVASSMGVILSVPLTAAIAAALFGKKGK